MGNFQPYFKERKFLSNPTVDNKDSSARLNTITKTEKKNFRQPSAKEDYLVRTHVVSFLA